MPVEVTSDDLKDLWGTVREAERQVSVQSESIKGLCDKLDTQVAITDRYFEAIDKRAAEEARRFDEYLKLQREHDVEQARRFDLIAKAHEDREVRFWKAITVLIGAVVALALGPKAAKSIADVCQDQPTSVGYCIPIPYNDQHDLIVTDEEPKKA